MDKTHPLLVPRYKLVASYPMCHYEVGHIYEVPNYAHESTKKAWIDAMNKFPHLYKKLEWWEERDRSSLPKYLRNTVEHMSHYGVSKDEVLKVDKYGPWDDQFIPTKFSKTYWLGYVIPATEEEYLAYIASQVARDGEKKEGEK